LTHTPLLTRLDVHLCVSFWLQPLSL